MSVEPGMRLGPYLLVAPLGAGGMGEVFRARDDRLGRDVAIKVLPEAVRSDAQRLRRFEQEARAVGALNHPNILVVFDFIEHPETPCIVTELLEGAPLSTRLSGKALPLRTAVDYAAQIARGLSAAHEKGLVHRDLKPGNLHVSDDGRVKILDFGLAKALPAPALALEPTTSGSTPQSGPAPVDGTVPGAVLGTVGYMSPEQARGEPADHRSDIFSLGAVFYEMLTGKPAFAGATGLEKAAAILHAEPPDAGAPPGVERVLKRCLEKQPARRFQSARDLSFALEGLLDPSGQIRPVRVRRLPWRALAAGLLLAAAGALLAVALRPDAGPAQWRRVTFRRGLTTAARFAPDGQTLVYSLAAGGAQSRIHTATVGNPEGRPILSPGMRLLAVSARGELALGIEHGGGALMTLARAPLSGGAPREVLEGVTGADWSPDGAELLAVRRGGAIEYPIGKQLLARPGAIDQARLSPAGDAVAYTRWPYGRSDDSGDVELATLDGAWVLLSGGWSSVKGLAWSPDGSEVWFTATRAGEGGARSLHAVDRRGRERLLASGPANLELADVARDGRALLLRDLSRRTIYTLGKGRQRDLGWFDSSHFVDLSADGKRVLFIEGGEASNQELISWVRELDGSPAVRLGPGNPLALAPDGSAAAITVSSRKSLTIVPTGPGLPRQLPAGGITSYEQAAWSKDGLIVQARESGQRASLWFQPLDGAPPRQFAAGCRLALMRPFPDGATALAIDEHDRLVLAPFDGSPPRPLRPLAADLRPIAGSADGRALLVLQTRPEAPWQLLRLELETGALEPLHTLDPPDVGGVTVLRYPWAMVSADWSTGVYQVGQALSDLYLASGLR